MRTSVAVVVGCIAVGNVASCTAILDTGSLSERSADAGDDASSHGSTSVSTSASSIHSGSSVASSSASVGSTVRDGGVDAHDATVTDGGGDVSSDTGHDTGRDTGRDSSHDTGIDATGICNTLASDKDAAPGAFDPTFNTVVETPAVATAGRLLQDPQGRIYLLGGKTDCVSATSNADFAITRLLPTGVIDTSYGGTGDTDAGYKAGGGTVCIDFVGGADILGGGAFDPMGNIIVGGLATLPAPTGAAAGRYYYTARAAFARLTPEGVLDPTFNGTGTNRVAAGPPEAQWVLSVATDDIGNVFAVGTTQAYPVPASDDASTATYTQHAGFIMKVGINGSVEQLWGNSGFVVDDNLTDLWGTIVSGSSIFAVGSDLGAEIDGGAAGALYHRHFVTRKYATNDPGGADPTFHSPDAGAGHVVTAAGENDYAQAVVVDPKGNVVVAGISSVGEPSIGGGGFNAGIYGPGYATVARYLPTGELDTTFGTGGIYVSPDLKGFPADEASMVALQCDGKTVVGGITSPVANVATGRQQVGVLRLTPTGAPDLTYGLTTDGGPGIAQFGLSYNVVLSSLLVDPEQRALILAGVGGTGSSGPVLTRFLP